MIVTSSRIPIVKLEIAKQISKSCALVAFFCERGGRSSSSRKREREKGRKKKNGMHISFRICARRGPFVVSTRMHTSTRCHNCPHVLQMSHFLQVCLLLCTKCPMHQPSVFALQLCLPLPSCPVIRRCLAG